MQGLGPGPHDAAAQEQQPLPCGRRSASGLSASQGAHHGLPSKQRELVRHAFLPLHARRVIRSVSLHSEVQPFPARPGPVLWRLLTPLCPSIAIADAVVRCVRTRPEASQGKAPLFPADPAGFTHAASGQLWGFTVSRRLTPRSWAFYPVPVRRGRDSPPASFRSSLATATLALGYPVSVLPPPVRNSHSRHRTMPRTQQRRARPLWPGPPLNVASSPKTQKQLSNSTALQSSPQDPPQTEPRLCRSRRRHKRRRQRRRRQHHP